MPKFTTPGKPTTRRYSPEEKAAAVRRVRTRRAALSAVTATGANTIPRLGMPRARSVGSSGASGTCTPGPPTPTAALGRLLPELAGYLRTGWGSSETWPDSGRAGVEGGAVVLGVVLPSPTDFCETQELVGI